MLAFFLSIDEPSDQADCAKFSSFASDFPEAMRIQQSAWIVRYGGTAAELRDRVRAIVGDAAKLWIGEIKGQCAWVAGDYATSLTIRSLTR